jgi:hypothetical protein
MSFLYSKHHRIDQAGSDIVQKLFEAGPVHVAAGKSVVILLGDGLPAFMALAADVGLTGFPLSLERVKRLL